jgi:long-chain acyl-CoA synthetase
VVVDASSLDLTAKYAITNSRTLDGMWRQRARLTPDKISHVDYVPKIQQRREFTWAQMLAQTARWQAALRKENLQAGDRVAVMLRNCIEWPLYDQAALALGLVVVPLYTVDRAENVAYILNDAGVKILLLETPEQWKQLGALDIKLETLQRVLMLRPDETAPGDVRVMSVEAWLPSGEHELQHVSADGNQLATIVYTSGTTGKPKGVMLTHENILSNVKALLQCIHIYPTDDILSFLPLSHMFERTVGYYVPVMQGVKTTYSRSVQLLADDLLNEKPNILIAVPRIFELIQAKMNAQLQTRKSWQQKLFVQTVEIGWQRFEWQQGRSGWRPSFLLWPLLDHLIAKPVRARFGGRLRFAASGGAALSPNIAKTFIALGIPILQGYGMTECSPVLAFNAPADNLPSSVGHMLPGIEHRLGLGDELQVKGPNIMQGYWNQAQATRDIFTKDGWLKTGDVVRVDASGHITITGRSKDIIVLSNGEKVPPSDMEMAIMRDTLFDQVMIIGEGKAFLSMLGVLNREQWKELAAETKLDPVNIQAAEKQVLKRVAAQIKNFPGYAQIRRGVFTLEPWSVENGLLTPTLKIRRPQVVASRAKDIDSIYDSMG